MKRQMWTVSIAFVYALMMSLLTIGCMTKYQPAPNMSGLIVSFADPEWGDQRVLAMQPCWKFRGEGITPRITVNNIPAGANNMVMEFSAANVEMMNNGGHG